MYISKLVIKNIKCFDEITINFRSNNDICMWGVILGDNGVGKTTILRSIAMSLCGKGSIFGLIDELSGDWIRRDGNEGSIRLEIEPEDKSNDHYYIHTAFTRESGNAIEITQKTKPDPFPWDKLFFCGYGATRGVSGTESYREYRRVEAILTLFSEIAELQNTEVPLRRIKDLDPSNPGKTIKDILNRIEEILMVPKDSIGLGKEGVTISGPWGLSMPLAALGDGHRATMSWVVDFLHWALFYDETMFQKELSATILIDEIEQHLHPQWQKSIVKLLREQFPKVQFIATTHSPLVAGNVGKLFKEDPETKLFYLRRDDDKTVKVSEIEENLGELDFDQILSSEAFGHIYNINPEIENVLREASVLAAKDKRTFEEEARYNKFKDKLKEIMFPEGRTLIERVIEREYYRDLEKKIEDFKEILKKEENDQN